MGLPLLGLPSGVHCRVILVMSTCSLRMMCPSPPPSHDDGVSALLIGLSKQLSVGDSVRPEDTQEFSEAPCF